MTILVVDDSKAMRMIIRRTMREAGFHHKLVEASSAAQALTVLQSTQIDLILSDWNMPEMNGMDLLLKLQTDGHAIKFGFVTTESSSEMQSTAKDAGAVFLITKPFTPESFRSALEPILGG
jgi:two-component system chemotaxis response regulator CheY